MAHLVPKDLKGEERWLSIPMVDLHFSKKGVFYNGIACILSAIILKFSNLWVFLFFFLLFNIIAYPLAHATIPKKQFEGGNVKYDLYLIRMIKYKKKKNIYIRRRGA